jgi:hypothetical protein
MIKLKLLEVEKTRNHVSSKGVRSKYVEEQLASPVSLGIQIRGNSQCYNLPLERSTAPGGTVLPPPHTTS